GCEGIGLMWTFLAVYLWVYRADLRFPRALLLFPLGTGLIWLSNAVRIAALVAVGTWLSPAVATTGFHSQAGWVAFLAISLGLVVLTRRVRFLRARGPDETAARGPNPTAAYLMPLLAVLATAMLTGAFSGGFDNLYALRALAAGAALWFFWRQYPGLRWSW